MTVLILGHCSLIVSHRDEDIGLEWDMGISIVMGVSPKNDGLFHRKSHLEMDDN